MEQKSESLTGKSWSWPQTGNCDENELYHHPDWYQSVLARRGITTQNELRLWTEKSLAKLADPSLMKDMDIAVELIATHLSAQNKIVVYGDYDVDGVSSTAIFMEFIKNLRGNVDFYIPDRKIEGYGLNQEAVEKIARSADLMVTADCGITSYKEIAKARELGLDVIVVDHHQVPEEMPPAQACLNPMRRDCDYPDDFLCAAGVIFVLCVGLRRHLREQGWFQNSQEPDVRSLLDLVALATVADMVPLLGINRTLVSAGLARMNTTPRPALKELFSVSGIETGQIQASDLGFRIGPRINARGRLEHAGVAVDLMLTNSIERAAPIAQALDIANQDRRELEKQTSEAAKEQCTQEGLDTHACIVIANENWHPGILGLVASRLSHTFNRPAIVIGEGGKGSARSVDGCNIHTAISKNSQYLLKFGGHRAAAGLTIEYQDIPRFRQGVIKDVESQLGFPPYAKVLTLDAELLNQEIDEKMLELLDALGPFGQENPEPIFAIRNVQLSDKRVVGREHLKLKVGRQKVDAIGFGMGQYLHELPDHVDLAFRLEKNYFRGAEKLQLNLKDIALRKASALQE